MITPDLTIADFCRKHRISKTAYQNLRSKGRGPVELKFGRAVRITAAAELEWEIRWTNPSPEDRLTLEAEAKARSRANSQNGKLALKSPRHGSKRPNRDRT